jgi:hypothetical protein
MKGKVMTQRKMPVSMADVELTEKWEGWKMRTRTNPPIGVFVDIASGEFARIAKGLAKVIVSWNFVDADGKDLPAPNEQVILDNLDADLAGACSNAFIKSITDIPPEPKPQS